MNIRNTRSVCPVCLKNIPARLAAQKDGKIFMEKICPEHGDFSTVIWKGFLPFSDWIREASPLRENEGENCPGSCGLCPEHLRGSCCVLMEITKRCNLRCAYCFADAGKDEEPSAESLLGAISDIAVKASRPMLQLSGGEPTMRSDLPELIRGAKEAGIPYIQVNTNGIRLAEDDELAFRLAEAGLDFVFLQFDSVDDRVYENLRGRALLDIKEKAVYNSGRAGLGVTLVPTVVPGVNLEHLGDIVRYAAEHSPVVRGVHFQPVSYFGRIPGGTPPDQSRCTLDELIVKLCEQTGILPEDLVPSRCDHPLCGFHGSFIAEDGKLIPLTKGSVAPRNAIKASENRDFVAKHWKRETEKEPSVRASRPLPSLSENAGPAPGGKYELRLPMEESRVTDMDTFLSLVRTYSFTLSSMPFQDAMNIDAERLHSCSLHVYDNGRLVPLCAEYLSPLGKMEEEK